MNNKIVKINKQMVNVKEIDGQRVVTFKDIDSVHQRPEGTARKRFNDNKKHLIEGEDFFVRKTDEAKKKFGITAPNGLILLTESGYLMLVKSFTDDLAWKVQRQLVKSYFAIKKIGESKKKSECLASVNNAVKILTPMLKAAGCNSQIQLLTAKSLYEKAGVVIPIEIKADQKYFDSVHIARQAGILYKSSGKPADKAVNEIIRRLNLSDSEYTETWEAKGNWQGPVRKYAETTIDKVKAWISEHNYPNEIEYAQYDGQVKRYHVVYRNVGVA